MSLFDGIMPPLQAPTTNGTSIAPVAVPVVRVGDIPDPGPVQWLVRDLWTANAFGIVGAEPKSWKSWLTLQLAICVASGTPLFRRYEVAKGRVLVFSSEGGKGLVRARAAMLCRALELDIKELDLEVLDVPSLRLDSEENLSVLVGAVATRRPTLVVLDPLRELHSGDENDAATIATLLLPLREMQRRFLCSIVVVHHMSKAGPDTSARRPGQRLRGSSALHGAVDSALYLEPRGEGEAKRIKVIAEHRGAPEPESLTLRLRTVLDPAGQATWLESVDVGADQEAREADEGVRTLARNRRRIVEAVRVGETRGEPLKSKRQIQMAAQMKREVAYALVDDLLAEGAIYQDDKKAFRVALTDRPNGAP